MRITDVRAICTAPAGLALVVVKVETSTPGLHGLGCATFRQRPLTVVTAVNDYLRPFLVGKDPSAIEDIWQSAYVSSYWRSGPVLNNALAGVDAALWDIKGKCANVPLYQLFGGKCRDYVPLYTAAGGDDVHAVEESVRGFMEQGYRYVKCSTSEPGLARYSAGSNATGWQRSAQGEPGSQDGHAGTPDDEVLGVDHGALEGAWEPTPYVRKVPRLFEHLRDQLGDSVELLHDVHERIPPVQALGLAKALEPFNLFFLEDPLAPEDNGYFRIMRQQTTTPIAMGELFVNQAEYVPLIQERLIDFIRVHISDIGGISVARKLAAFCEFYGVRTAWHGPADVSPVGHAANMHLDFACHNFGIQEQHVFNQAAQDVFPGTPEIRNGAMWSNERPGLGVELDEELAARFPLPEMPYGGGWAPLRRDDGTVVSP